MSDKKKVKYMTEAELEKYYPGLARGEIYNYDKKKNINRRLKQGEKKIKNSKFYGYTTNKN